jgi:serine/threonine protein kinase
MSLTSASLGALANGRFELGRVIGSGGSGVVYEAYDRLRHERVALKTLRRAGPESLLRLKQEFRALTDVAHPNLIGLRELGVGGPAGQGDAEGDSCFFTMELVEGCDFITWVRGGRARPAVTELAPTVSGVLPIAVATPRDDAGDGTGGARRPAAFDELRLRTALLQLAGAVHALHGLGKLHRDLKPSNVLVRGDGHLLVLDYGLVSEIGAPSASFEGTPHYAAPEQASGVVVGASGASRAIGAAADWYAVGVMLFEALTGALPFDGSPAQILFDKRARPAPDPEALVDGVPPDLGALCRALLRTAPAERPDGRAILAAFAVHADEEPQAAFFGRERELEALDRAVARATSGSPELLIVEGPSGIGKSTLVARMLERARAHAPEAWLLAGRCHHRESVPYNALDGVVDALARALSPHASTSQDSTSAHDELRDELAVLARLFPTLAGVAGATEGDTGRDADVVADPGALRVRACASLAKVLAHAASSRLLVVWIDDLQWADADSLELLGELLRANLAGVLVILSQRPAALRISLPPAHRIALGPLDASDARALLASLAPARTGEADVAALVQQAAGHPMLLAELARQVRLGGSGAAPGDLDEALRRRVAALEPNARAMVELLAVCVSETAEDVLGHAARLSADELARVLAELVAAHLVRTATRAAGFVRVAPYHDRVREAVLASLDLDTRASLHRKLADAVVASGREDPERIVHHRSEAGDVEGAAAFAREAAERALSALAFDRAASLLRVALRGGASRPLMHRLAEALHFARRGVEAAAVYEEIAQAETEVDARRDALRRASELLLTSGELDRGLAIVRQLLAEIGLPLPRTVAGAAAALAKERALLALERKAPSRATPRRREELDLLRSVALGLGMSDNLRAAIYMTRWLRGAFASGDEALAGQALALEAVFRGSLGGEHRREAYELLARADAIAARVRDPELECWARGTRATVDALGSASTEAIERLRQAWEGFHTRTRGNGWVLTSLQLVRALSVRIRGDFRSLRALLPEVLADARRRSDLYLETTMRRGANVLFLVDDDPGGARTMLADTRWEAPTRGFHFQHWLELEAIAETALYEGRGARMLDEHAAPLRRLRWSTVQRQQRVRVLARSLQARLLLSRAAEGRSVARSLLECAWLARGLEAESTPHSMVRGAMIRAGIASIRGEREVAARRLRWAIEHADAEGLALVAASARRRLGALEGGDEGRALVAAADAWFASQGVRVAERLARIEAPF